MLHVPINSPADRLLRRLWSGVIEERLEYLQHVAAIAQHVSLSDQRGARRHHRLARVQGRVGAPSFVSRGGRGGRVRSSAKHRIHASDRASPAIIVQPQRRQDHRH